MKRFTRVLALGCFASVLLLSSVLVAQAASSGIQISPLTYNLDIKPGESQQAVIKVTNLNTTDLNYVIETENIDKVSNEGAPSFAGTVTDNSVTTLKDWITPNNPADSSGVIAPGVSKDITFNVSIPVGADPGGHYAAIFAKEIKKNVQGQTQLGVSSRVGTIILVSVPGNVKKTVSLKDFLVSKFIWKGPISMTAKADNTGSVHYDSQVKVDIKPIFGATSEVDLGKHTIIPTNERNYEGSWNKKYPFGYYKFTASASDGDGNFTSTQTATAFALPLIIVLPLIAAIIIVLLVVKYVKRNFKVVKAGSTRKE